MSASVIDFDQKIFYKRETVKLHNKCIIWAKKSLSMEKYSLVNQSTHNQKKNLYVMFI